MKLHFDLDVGDCVSLCVSFSWRISLPSSCFVFTPFCGLFVWPLTSFLALVSFQALFVFVILPTVSCATAPSPAHQGDATKPTLTAVEEGRTHDRRTSSSLGECASKCYPVSTALIWTCSFQENNFCLNTDKCQQLLFRPTDVDLPLQARKVFNWNVFDLDSTKTHKPSHSYPQE